ncbi:hypothetical protein D9619_011403 [Psilocybe cf. subviscida]|uniref:Amidohydrolase 3 domain-containing protein n=1 Tax=Psilocybe cf. subviscida TaxID=2480587 RepID=A0A8H5BJG5_9AGAR|nr:hypothetical protein D9619_011403 [Psilocybe cf. subviscida]
MLFHGTPCVITGVLENMHCIGDRANHLALDVLEKISRNHADRLDNSTTWRPRIEHALMLNSSNLERMRELGGMLHNHYTLYGFKQLIVNQLVIASVQPTQAQVFLTTDMFYAERRLGFDRAKDSYAYRSLLNASSWNVLPLGSDFPVEGVNPLYGFHAAITRLSPEGISPHGSGGWFPDQRLTREQALKGMTSDAAYASFSEQELGSITVGKKADFVVFDRDIMTIPSGNQGNSDIALYRL